MIEVTIRIPEMDNDGVPFDRALLDSLLERFAREFGGYEMRGRIQGGWTDDEGRLVRDDNTLIAVWLDSWRQLAAFIDLADWTRVAFRQQAIGITVSNVPEILT